MRLTALIVLAPGLFTHPALAQEITPTEGLVARPLGSISGVPFAVDEVQARLASGKWKAPIPGEAIKLATGGEGKWEKIAFDKQGRIGGKGLFGAYVSTVIPLKEDGYFSLEAAGHSLVYVNGEPRVGDIYSSNNVRLPVYLHKGDNELLFYGSRGQIQVKLRPLLEGAKFQPENALLPDVFEGQERDYWGSIVVANISKATLRDAKLRVRFAGTEKTFDVPSLLPLSTRAIAFQLHGKPDLRPGKNEAVLQLTSGEKTLDERALNVPIVSMDRTHRRTFLSQIDGSVQYYAVVPACKSENEDRADRPGLILTLHGASVEASGQAAAYACKPWCHIVAPTNRRPFGFDWEDWGRLDAMEVLEHASKDLAIDPSKVWLTGHSMGGHGTWHVGVTYPDRFAAIGPSAGWISFWTYGRGPRAAAKDPFSEVFHRANNGSDTLDLLRNLERTGVYVLHGDRDDNVPVTQARTVVKALSTFHKDLQVHEQKGAGHWWDLPGPGADCVDWPAMMDFFRKHQRPALSEVSVIDFSTASPGISSRSHWAEILQQDRPMQPGRIQLRREKNQIVGETKNVRLLALSMDFAKDTVRWNITLDGKELKEIQPDRNGRILLHKLEDGWHPAMSDRKGQKGPTRHGPFREAFRNRMIFVHGTRGTDEENAWSLRKARFDAETFWYRGNGSIDIMADTDFDPKKDKDRNVILYGNADTNAAWKLLLGHSPIQVSRDGVRVAERHHKAANLACLFVYPRTDSETGCIGVVSGTGAEGCRMTDRLPIFVSGMGYPDFVLASTDVLRLPFAPGLIGAGYFSNEWQVKGGDFAWRK